MYPRRLIISDRSLTHVFFRCHNRQFLLQPPILKRRFIFLLAKYKRKYGIQIFEFNIMDNHAHLIVRASSAANLGDFMRTVNSQLARAINEYHRRDSQAIRERFNSPVITSKNYLLKCMQYVWLNRYKVNRSLRPELDFFCSAAWRLSPPYKVREKVRSDDDYANNLLATLLDSYTKLELGPYSNVRDFIRQLIEEGIESLESLCSKKFENVHTIGDSFSVSVRGEYLSAFSRGQSPPI